MGDLPVQGASFVQEADVVEGEEHLAAGLMDAGDNRDALLGSQILQKQKHQTKGPSAVISVL